MVQDDGPVGLDRVRVVFDDPRAVSDARIVLVAMLAERLGLAALAARFGRLGERVGPANAGRKVMTPLFAIVLGADCSDDCHLLTVGASVGAGGQGDRAVDAGNVPARVHVRARAPVRPSARRRAHARLAGQRPARRRPAGLGRRQLRRRPDVRQARAGWRQFAIGVPLQPTVRDAMRDAIEQTPSTPGRRCPIARRRTSPSSPRTHSAGGGWSFAASAR